MSPVARRNVLDVSFEIRINQQRHFLLPGAVFGEVRG